MLHTVQSYSSAYGTVDFMLYMVEFSVQLRENTILHGPTVQLRKNTIVHGSACDVQLREITIF